MLRNWQADIEACIKKTNRAEGGEMSEFGVIREWGKKRSLEDIRKNRAELVTSLLYPSVATR
jgi:hypothetical protein